MRKFVPLVVALVMSLGAHAQESETVLYERLAALAPEVISENLNGPLCSPGPDLDKKQAELANLVSQATLNTAPMMLELAVMANSLSDVRRLHEGGKIPPGPWGTLLQVAAIYGNPAMLEYLVDEGFELGDVGEGATIPALGLAVTAGNIENIKWLIANGANVNATDTSGVSVIGHSMVCKDQALVDLLLEAGAVPDDRAREVAQRLGISLEPD